ncbi:TadE/TadG family type IV pilus assembly protein [Phyllobacterium endophyticum]|uniref:TadE/TadG family type IV pilus assembly protein n=1 Tax=Phyllobacterium endophyticum TaxID=1149773 RepID=UPI0011CB5BDA|nr:TadE/TadG family type IV pilus assembly protein [Phyllobacterium endophyticum]TXR46589.1 pilus assembly protein [Phyllobacterium endophyticum]
MKKIQKFLKDRSGATAITFGLMLVPLMGMTGLAVDYSVASNERSKLQNAADSAALAGASIFTGTNAVQAEARARAYLKANLGNEAADAVSINFSAANQLVTVSLNGQSNTTFMRILNKNSMPIGVTATALAPLKPSSATIKVDDVFGYWFKRVTIVAVKNGVETVVGTVVYQPTDHSGENGRGIGTTTPTKDQMQSITLGDYDSVYLKMEVKTDGCDIGYANKDTRARMVVCEKNKNRKTYDSTLRTDDPLTVNHLFVDGKQLPAGSTPPLTDIFSCEGGTHKHAWEDGGGWDKQDFFYTVTSACKAVDNESVRLTD